jgi:hypothetical protein
VSWSALLHGRQSPSWHYVLRNLTGSSWPRVPLVVIAVALAIASATIWAGSTRRAIGAGIALAVLATGGLVVEIALSGAARTQALAPAVYREVPVGVLRSVLVAEMGRPDYAGAIVLPRGGARLQCLGYVSTLADRVVSVGPGGVAHSNPITRSPYVTGAGDDYLFCFAGSRLARKLAI